MSGPAAVAPGRQVTLHYTLALADGTVLDSTDGEAPITLRIGSGELVGFLEQRLVGLRAGERARFEISAADSAAAAGDGRRQQLARTDFPPGLEPVPGQVIGFRTPGGEELPGQVIAVSEHEVTVDFSHPLAGRNLTFDVEIVAVEP